VEVMAITQNDTAGFLSIQLDRNHLDRLVQGALSAQALKRAETRAINETCVWMKGKLLQLLPAATGIPRKILSRRVRNSKAKANLTQGISGKVWFGTRPIDAIFLKDEGPVGTGYMAGGFYFEGGFKAKMKTGHVGIFARAGKKRMPIKTQKVEIDNQTQEVVRRLIAPAELALMQKMTRLVNWELEQACR
jgi:hypothetical protein